MSERDTDSTYVEIEGLCFDNRFTNELNGDPDLSNTRRQVSHAYFSKVQPTETSKPETLAISIEALNLLGLEAGITESDNFAQVFSGNALTRDMEPHAMCYGGHQFGNWAGQLGDGRAINLGEVIGKNDLRYMLQLKGAGPTPYSRSGDGRAVLRSSIREFLCSEAMFSLGVPTTRALSLCATGDQVMRDMLYDGNPAEEPGAVVCRTAPSFIRFGNFEIFAARGEVAELKALLDFSIRHYFPEVGEPSPSSYVRLFEKVVASTAVLIAHWQRVGFVHGVMNTDNMSIHGLTIDYGPYGWVDNFDPNWTPNTTDRFQRRYRFRNQPAIAHWNLAQLANALYPAVQDVQPLQEALDAFEDLFNNAWSGMIAEKLGLNGFSSMDSHTLLSDLFEIIESEEVDMTIFFRSLSKVSLVEGQHTEQNVDVVRDSYYTPELITGEHWHQLGNWMDRYVGILQSEGLGNSERMERMNKANPKYVLRNYLAQLAIDDAENGDLTMVNDLLMMLRNPYDEQPEFEKWATKRPDWARNRPGCSMLSCSS